MIVLKQNFIKTFYDSMSPIMIISKLAGVCSLTKKENTEEIQRSKFMIGIQVIVIIISVAHLGFIPYAVMYIEEMPEISFKINVTLSHHGDFSSQKFITKMANIVLISIMSILVRISNLLQMSKHFPGFLNDMQNVDRMIPLMDNRDFRRNVILSAVLIIVSWPYQIYSILVVSTDSWMAFLLFYLNLYNNFSIICCEFQFVSLCWILDSRFEKLNQHLNELSSKQYGGNTALEKLTVLKKCSRLLTNAFTKLNSLHGFQLLIILSGLSLNVLFGLYFTIFGGFTKNSNKTSLAFQRISNVINETLWSFYYLTRFIFVCVVAGDLTVKANSPRKIISNILDNTTTTQVLQQQLWIFLSHTLTHKMFVTASGFFRINKALITSAVSMGTTYLVILAQFQRK